MRLKGAGELDEALEMVLKALDTRKKLYGEQNHADICRSLITVGRIYAARDEHEVALEFFHDAITVAQAEEVKDTRLEARALDDLGASYYEMGKQDDAIHAYQRCFDIREKILGSHHKLTTKVRNKLNSIIPVE